jgi:hypothetical protein
MGARINPAAMERPLHYQAASDGLIQVSLNFKR